MNKLNKIIPAVVLIVLTLSYLAYSTFIKENEKFYYGEVTSDIVALSAPATSEVNKLNASEGQLVKEGDSIVSLFSSEYEYQISKAELEKQNIQSEENTTVNEKNASDISTLEILVSIEKDNLELNKKNLSSMNISMDKLDKNIEIAKNNLALYNKNVELEKENLDSAIDKFNSGEITLEVLNKQKAVYESANTQAKNTQSSIDSLELDKKALSENIASQKLLIEISKQKVSIAQNNLDKYLKGPDQVVVGKFDNSEKIVDLSSEYLQSRKSDLEVISPTEGIVENINYSVGEYVPAGAKIAIIRKTNEKYVYIYVNESDFQELKLDQKVVLINETTSIEYSGSISYISDKAEFTPVNIVSTKDRERLVFKIKINLKDSQELKSGIILKVLRFGE